ncbi:MAG: ECF transporter S component [Ruminococcaceae bacterium]|nr:ECF transporter S component [Oscillospiraceae bacterium]
MNKKNALSITYAALCLALALVLPFLTGQIPQIGKALAPMHIAVFLCGFVCGWPYGLLVGFIAPLLRSAIFGFPIMFPEAVSMAFELATYGLISGLLYKVFPKKTQYIYLSLLTAMACGRLIWGAVRYCLAGLTGSGFPFSAFWAGAVANAVPGIILHILLLPLLVVALKKANVILNQ